MAREKATITVDRDKLNEARALVNAASASAAIDRALTDLIRRERVRRDVEAYLAVPQTDEEASLRLVVSAGEGLHDETDWEALYDDGDDA